MEPVMRVDAFQWDESTKGSEIISIDCFPLRLPLRKPLIMSTYRLDDGPVLYVRVRSQSGAEGWGEAAASPVMTGETLPGMVACVRELISPHVIGASVFDRALISSKLRSAFFANGGALAAVDMAMLDLAGQIQNVPVADLLGGALRRSIRPLWLIGGSGSIERDVEDAKNLYSQQFRAFKLKVGVGTLQNDVETVAQLRAALGQDCLIAADANMGWGVKTSVDFGRSVASHGVAFLEQPVAPGDVARMAAVAAGCTIPIGADESIHGLADIVALVNAKAIHGLSMKTIKLGGVTQIVKLANTCDALGLSINLAMMMESSLATAAMIQTACVIPNVDWGLSLGNLWLAEEPIFEPVSCKDGYAICPKGPGLGVKVDERRLSAFAA
jgi:L-alanine-DL-glutamate epimerase-like enolase superfamily enzyme